MAFAQDSQQATNLSVQIPLVRGVPKTLDKMMRRVCVFATGCYF